MNRRKFIKTAATGIAVAPAIMAEPFRVGSEPFRMGGVPMEGTTDYMASREFYEVLESRVFEGIGVTKIKTDRDGISEIRFVNSWIDWSVEANRKAVDELLPKGTGIEQATPMADCPEVKRPV